MGFDNIVRASLLLFAGPILLVKRHGTGRLSNTHFGAVSVSLNLYQLMIVCGYLFGPYFFFSLGIFYVFFSDKKKSQMF